MYKYEGANICLYAYLLCELLTYIFKAPEESIQMRNVVRT